MAVHFPRLDADLYIPGLLEGFLGSKRWMAAEIGKIGGTASTEAKAAAARQNGKLGGRPKKAKRQSRRLNGAACDFRFVSCPRFRWGTGSVRSVGRSPMRASALPNPQHPPRLLNRQDLKNLHLAHDGPKNNQSNLQFLQG
ncbi:MAG: hypothetical protein MZW92_60910 [Comamonadaceae bacterium]|nr:hypothetical protein [Comamonadaceae bacterium]